MSVNIQINKKTDDGYETFYPTNSTFVEIFHFSNISTIV